MFKKIVRKIKSIAVFKISSLYKPFLQSKKLQATDKPLSDRHVVMMVGKKYLPYARWAVFSIARNWDSLPKLTIVNDGSLDDTELKETFNFWKGQLHINAWQDSVDFHKNQNRSALVRYAESHPFGKKMAIILQHASFSPTVWLDSDILFFKEPGDHLPAVDADFICGATEDWVRAYDNQVLYKLADDKLNKVKFMNAGLLYVYGKDIYERFNLENLLEQIHPNYHYYTEQTIFAYIATKSAGILWDQTIVKNNREDAHRIKSPVPSTQMARHYTSLIRPLFWRDVMFNLN